MSRLYDHIDLRVSDLSEVTSFYETLLPALGFGQRIEVEGWLQYEAPNKKGECPVFFGVTESASYAPNENRIAFWAESEAKVDELAKVAKNAGAAQMEGPMPYEPGYYAFFFEDPCGNRFEICHRVKV